MGKINNSLAKQIKKLAEDLNANGELTSDVEIIIEPEVKDDALNYCDSCDKTSEECICDNEDDCDCSDAELDEGEYNSSVKDLKDRRSERLAEIEDYKKRLNGTDKSNKEMIKRLNGSIKHLKQVVKFYDKRIANSKE